MKDSYKFALLAALGLASVSAVQAQSDLIVGVFQTGDANTTAVDIGAYSALTSGETWDLSGAVSAAGISLSSTGVFGVVGDVKGTSSATKIVYVTDAGTPNTFTGASAFNLINAAVQTIGSAGLGTQTAGSGYDWSSETDPTVSGSTAANLGYSMSGLVTGPIDLWSVADNGSAPVLDGTFTLNPANDLLTYNAVPEPTTLGLLGGAGLLILSFRKKFARN